MTELQRRGENLLISSSLRTSFWQKKTEKLLFLRIDLNKQFLNLKRRLKSSMRSNLSNLKKSRDLLKRLKHFLKNITLLLMNSCKENSIMEEKRPWLSNKFHSSSRELMISRPNLMILLRDMRKGCLFRRKNWRLRWLKRFKESLRSNKLNLQSMIKRERLSKRLNINSRKSRRA